MRHHGEKNRAAMPFRQNEAVAIRPLGIAGIVTQHIEKQRDDNFSRRKGPPRLARASLGDHLDHRASHAFGDGSQLSGVADFLHGLYSMYHPDRTTGFR